jgi:hypothetical protein
MEALFRPRMQWVLIERQGVLGPPRQQTNKGQAQTSRDCLPARKEVDVASFLCHFPPPHDSEWADRAKKRRKLMVPVNGTRVGRVGERKRSEVHFNSSATGTAVFDKSAMSRLKEKMNEERIGYR